MLSLGAFELLLKNSESSILDFKSTMYDFFDDKDLQKTAKFVKDVLSFSNTIRNETSYIILGVGENEDGTRNLCGIQQVVDDAVLQDKVKDRVFPRPNFVFYSLNYEGKLFGVVEFPVTKYSLPVSPTVKMKGLEIGHIYYRRGTTNGEAVGHEIININNWLQSLPEAREASSLSAEVTELIKRLTRANEKLSVVFADLLMFSKNYKLIELSNFCTSEIKGLYTTNVRDKIDEYQYRVQGVLMSLDIISINPYVLVRPTDSSMKNEMKSKGDFHEVNMLFSQSLPEIEEHIEVLNNSTNTLCLRVEVRSTQIFRGEGKDYPVQMYLFKNDLEAIYRSIRQKAIDHLVQI